MKKILITLSIALTIFLSFGFILINRSESKQIAFEEVSGANGSETSVISEVHDNQW